MISLNIVGIYQGIAKSNFTFIVLSQLKVTWAESLVFTLIIICFNIFIFFSHKHTNHYKNPLDI